MKLVLLLVLVLATGCAVTDKAGTTHHLVIGFGVVSVSHPSSAAQVIKATTVGLGISSSPPGCQLGYGSSITTYVNSGTNLVIEVSELPGKPLTIETR